MSNLDAQSVCRRLEADKTLATLFDILRDYGEAPNAYWLNGEQERTRTYAEMALRADDYAACINSLGLEDGWIGVAVDTCHLTAEQSILAHEGRVGFQLSTRVFLKKGTIARKDDLQSGAAFIDKS